MNAPPAASHAGFRGRFDVLSAAEESVLCELRDLVLRARGGPAGGDRAVLRAAVVAAGASIESEDDRDGVVRFSVRGVRFSLSFADDGSASASFPLSGQ